MTRITTTLLALILATTLVPPGADAQLSGVVTDTSGVAIEGAVVEAWGSGARLASRVTDSEGYFSFSSAVAARASSLHAGRLGYRTEEEPVVAGRSEYHIRLAEQPISLDELVVQSQPDRCDADDQDEARRIWNRMRARYAGPMDTVGIATYLSQADTLVSEDEIAPFKVGGPMLSQRGSSSQLRFSWTRMARRSGYAFPVRRTQGGSSFDSWSYAPLQAGFAPHFVDEVFGDLHRFRIRDQGDFGWYIEFCPRERDRPSIRGTMQIGPDTTLTSVEWLFRTPEPDEHAGGRAYFPPVSGPPERSYPLPTESIVWRQLPSGRFQEVEQRFEGWTVAPGDTVPFLPPRKPHH